MKTEIKFDELNIYVRNKIPTNRYLKIFLFIFNISAFIGLLGLAFYLQKDKPNIFAFLLPIGYGLTLGKYLLWNTSGEELLTITSNTVSYQYNYHLWKSKFETRSFDSLSGKTNDVDVFDNPTIITFFKYNHSKNLEENVFESALDLSFNNYLDICYHLDKMRIRE